MSKLILIRDRSFQDHLTPQIHPESPKRLAGIDKVLTESGELDKLTQSAPRLASEDEIALVHNASHVEALLAKTETAKSTNKIVPIDNDTFISAGSYDIARLAAGAGLVAVDSLDKSDTTSAFVAVRPPGHHALAQKAMGFCLFNNIAIAARHAEKAKGLQRILIIDWDVHHGNGTQDLFYKDPGICFVSFHQYPCWPPGSGWYTDDGEGEGKGYNINIPLPAGTGDRGYLEAWDTILAPIAMEYKPQLILVSAGYDAHQADPLADQRLSTAGFANLSLRLDDLATKCQAKVACFLEGGYNVDALSHSVLATIQVLNGDPVLDASATGELTGDKNPAAVDERVSELKTHFAKYWKNLR